MCMLFWHTTIVTARKSINTCNAASRRRKRSAARSRRRSHCVRDSAKSCSLVGPARKTPMVHLISDADVHGHIVRDLRGRKPNIDLVRVQEVGLRTAEDSVILE